MKRLFKAMHRNEKGFTLVELLIVFALLAVLAAIVIPNVATFAKFGQGQAATAEKSIVQTAMDSMMAKVGLTSVTPPTTPTDNMTLFPNTTYPLYPGYLRFEMAKGTYNCDATGLVAQTATGY